MKFVTKAIIYNLGDTVLLKYNDQYYNLITIHKEIKIFQTIVSSQLV